MQAAPTMPPSPKPNFSRNLSYFLAGPLTAFVIGVLFLTVSAVSYQSRHSNQIFTGVTVSQVDVGGMTTEQAEAELAAAFGLDRASVTLIDVQENQTYLFTPRELGLQIDWQSTLDKAYGIGRSGNPLMQMQEMFDAWYYGRSLSPIFILDKGQQAQTLNALAQEINRPAINSNIIFANETIQYQAGQKGRGLDIETLAAQLDSPLTQFQPVEIELLIHDIVPTLADTAAVSNEIERTFSSPVSFYLQEPLDELDLDHVVLPQENLAQWLRVDVSQADDGRFQHNIFIDEVALRQWLAQYADTLYRDPVNARFYFDDFTRELVLVAPHINGRELDIEATVALFQEQIKSSNRSIPFVMREIVPEVHKDVTAVELGITELITETTTWFYGSSAERKHNIARAAANFFGIVIAPGEEFSFNKYLGSISEAEGYEQGFVIIGGIPVEGIGGGVCQVSTTLYQAAFNAGFPITERWPHGYMLNYYNDGEGPGMDATVYSPIVDIKFINNTPYHLLIENYYSTENEALTFKFYSTDLGRQVVKESLPWQNVTEVPPQSEDRWEFNPDLEPGEVVQIDYATEGADVSVRRLVYNADGVLISENLFTSNYIPVPNVYQYGPGVEPFDYSKVPNN